MIKGVEGREEHKWEKGYDLIFLEISFDADVEIITGALCVKMQLIKLINRMVVMALRCRFGRVCGEGDFSQFSQNKRGTVIN